MRSLLFLTYLSANLFALVETTIKVEGMHCPACTFAVRKSLENTQGVKEAKAFLKTATATVISDMPIEDAKLIEAVKNVGYGAKIAGRKER